MQRRLPEDDQWVVPHNLYMTMFSPSSVNVLNFDPHHGCDQARGYATKYASKPEKWYYMESEKQGGLVEWLKARTAPHSAVPQALPINPSCILNCCCLLFQLRWVFVWLGTGC